MLPAFTAPRTSRLPQAQRKAQERGSCCVTDKNTHSVISGAAAHSTALTAPRTGRPQRAQREQRERERHAGRQRQHRGAAQVAQARARQRVRHQQVCQARQQRRARRLKIRRVLGFFKTRRHLLLVEGNRGKVRWQRPCAPARLPQTYRPGTPAGDKPAACTSAGTCSITRATE